MAESLLRASRPLQAEPPPPVFDLGPIMATWASWGVLQVVELSRSDRLLFPHLATSGPGKRGGRGSGLRQSELDPAGGSFSSGPPVNGAAGGPRDGDVAWVTAVPQPWVGMEP